jgi:hypothetical protein
MSEDRMFRWEREVPREWERELRVLSPSLAIHWVPGTYVSPIQRWVLFECVPARHVSDFAWAQLWSGPIEDPVHRWAVDVFHATQTVPTPVWVLQGWPQGHPRRFTRAEAVIAQAYTASIDPPEWGTLPYREFSPIVIPHLARRDASFRLGIVDPERARVLDEQEAQRAARRLQVEQTLDSMRDAVKEAAPALMDLAVPVDKESDMRWQRGDLSEMIGRYVETGSWA